MQIGTRLASKWDRKRERSDGSVLRGWGARRACFSLSPVVDCVKGFYSLQASDRVDVFFTQNGGDIGGVVDATQMGAQG